MKNTGAQRVVRWIENRGIEVVFAVPGLQIQPLLEALAESKRIRSVYPAHELAAGYMADGYARATGRLGICASIGSVGAQAFLPAVATAGSDDVPVLFLTGDVATKVRGCGAFQDSGPEGTRDAEVFAPLVRDSVTVRSPGRVEAGLDRLHRAAFRAPPGPVHVCLPLDVLSGTSEAAHAEAAPRSQPAARASDARSHRRFLERLVSARRPVILAGHRAGGLAGAPVLRRFAETYEIPVATTLAAKGLLPEGHRLSLGNFGFAGSRRAHEALLGSDADLLLVLGADWGERDTLCWDPRLTAAPRDVLHVDSKGTGPPRPGGPGSVLRAECPAVLGHWLTLAATALEPLSRSAVDRRRWARELAAVPRWFTAAAASPAGGMVPLEGVVTTLRSELPEDTILLVDAGLHRVFAGHYWTAPRPGDFFSACGLAPMGWGIAAAAGVQLARPHQPVCVLTGDGCLRAHGLELATFRDQRLPILVVGCINGGYASSWRRASLAGQAGFRMSVSNWPGFAEALGAAGREVTSVEALAAAIRDFVRGRRIPGQNGPMLVAVRTPLDQPLPEPSAALSSATTNRTGIRRSPR
jgi:acetolactate synthase-1/2/3 large subunit